MASLITFIAGFIISIAEYIISKKWKLVIITFFVSLIAATLLFFYDRPIIPGGEDNTPPPGPTLNPTLQLTEDSTLGSTSTDWSDWVTDLPTGVNASSFDIITKTQYAYQQLSMETSDWSEWQSSLPMGENIIQMEQQYRVSAKVYQDSPDPNLAEWTQYGDPSKAYGNWSDIIEGTPPDSTATFEVKPETWTTSNKEVSKYDLTTNVYRYNSTWRWSAQPNATYRSQCTGWYHENYYRNDVTPSQIYAYEDGYKIIGDSAEPSNMDSCRWYINSSKYNDVAVNHYGYRKRSVTTTYHYWKWGSWSDWTIGFYSGNTNDIQIENRFRYINGTEKWGEWSPWQDIRKEISNPNAINEKSRVVYKYKQK